MYRDFDYSITINKDIPLTHSIIRKINSILRDNPKANILLEVPNTLYLSENILDSLDPKVKIRIAGAYDKDRLDIYKDYEWTNKFTKEKVGCKEYYFDSVIYSRNESKLLLETIKSIEENIDKEWSDIEKLVYIYTMLKRNIMYDPKFETKSNKQVRTLRGLISHESVCAGFALILKEFLDRQGIPCHYIRGHGHAWNIVEIEGNLYPVDLTFENKKYRSGMDKSFTFLGQGVKSFNNKHKPSKKEPFNNYQRNLKEFNPQMLESIYKRVFREYDYKMTTYISKRKNTNERFLIVQIGSKIINDKTYYKYYYVELNGKKFNKNPMIVYSNKNICKYIDEVRWKAKNKSGLSEQDIIEGLFSKENLEDSKRKKTSFIGNTEIENGQTIILKEDKECAKFKEIPLVFNRTDGTTFVLEKDGYAIVNGIKVYRYNLYEMIKEKGKSTIKNNVIYSEQDLMKENSSTFKDILLSSKRISVKEKNNGGYVGTIDKDGKIQTDEYLKKYFKRNKKNNVTAYNEYTNNHIHMPTFIELEELYKEYDIFEVEVDNCRNSEALVFRKDNAKMENKHVIAPMAYFAHIWHMALGSSAFQPKVDTIYNTMCEKFKRDIITRGVIDIEGLLRELKSIEELEKVDVESIVYNLFSNYNIACFINDLFAKSVNPNKESNKLPTIYTDEKGTGYKN